MKGFSNSHLQLLYKGFFKSPLLWSSNPVLGLQQLQIDGNNNRSTFKRPLEKKLRLGQLAEQFVFNQLEQVEDCMILAENIQIQKERQTLGELDALIRMHDELIHLEIVYKFYLYDETLGTEEIEQWIGPNRSDSLIEKITKLKNKQLPLLYSQDCKPTLKQLNLEVEHFQQQVLFKAQLFKPYKTSVVFEQLNEDCVNGCYLNQTQLEDFKNSEFFIPQKLDWFLEINDTVTWLGYNHFKTEVNLFLEQKKSPLIWIKKPDKVLLKCFLVWW